MLTISKDTGISDIVFDPRNPDVIFASAYQRRRHVGQMIGGGPEGGIYKTTNAGKTWTKLTKGLPTGDMGRAGLAIDGRKNPATVFALIDAKRPGVGLLPLGRWRQLLDADRPDAAGGGPRRRQRAPLRTRRGTPRAAPAPPPPCAPARRDADPTAQAPRRAR